MTKYIGSSVALLRGDCELTWGDVPAAGGVSSISSLTAEACKGLTSDELEGLGDHLLAAVVSVLVVRHDCAWSWCVFGVEVAAMAGVEGRDEVKLAMADGLTALGALSPISDAAFSGLEHLRASSPTSP